ncbi:hypothetical protein SAMN05216350_105104 [Polaromonas sp. YR568]|uniref:STY0301 family protein n=1 Tax=Polaromonas sp. YR568 TaxID=1855301 RepID=UPI0008EE1072|nr:STY0301 family protein [Polaromonas sp. YR568]SFU78666.1 hypothetical protein SAMN05216350_105104 [Polaromonas sp. YR568]
MRRISWIALASLSMASLGAHAAPVVLTCPSTLAVAESAKPPAGWEAVPAGHPRAFSNLGLFSGHPREMASLVPDKQNRSGKQLLSTWNLPGGSERYWLACGYTQSALQAAQPLPAGLTRCTATHTGPNAALQASPELRCE